jgi:hypothetical protein
MDEQPDMWTEEWLMKQSEEYLDGYCHAQRNDPLYSIMGDGWSVHYVNDQIVYVYYVEEEE